MDLVSVLVLQYNSDCRNSLQLSSELHSWRRSGIADFFCFNYFLDFYHIHQRSLFQAGRRLTIMRGPREFVANRRVHQSRAGSSQLNNPS
jgi:hypothetical protein